MKLIGYLASAVNVVSSNPCAVPLLIINTILFLLSIWTDEPISTPKIINFFLMLSSVNGNSERESNAMPQSLFLYFSRSVFLVSYTDPNKQIPNVKSAFGSLGHCFSM